MWISDINKDILHSCHGGCHSGILLSNQIVLGNFGISLSFVSKCLLNNESVRFLRGKKAVLSSEFIMPNCRQGFKLQCLKMKVSWYVLIIENKFYVLRVYLTCLFPKYGIEKQIEYRKSLLKSINNQLIILKCKPVLHAFNRSSWH